MDTEFSNLPIYFFGYDEIETFCLSKREQLTREGVGLILGVLRGGGIPALMLSQMLGIPVDFVHYDRQGAKAEIKNEAAFSLIHTCIEQGKKVLLVEDIAGVGRTLIHCHEYVLSIVKDRSLVKTLALVYHESSRMKPDYFKDCSGVRAILPWERYVTSRLCLNDFLSVGEALMDDQRYKKILSINGPVAPLNLRQEWVVDHHLEFDGDYESMLETIKEIGPEEIYCNDESIIGLVLSKFPFIVAYKVIDQKRYRMSAVD